MSSPKITIKQGSCSWTDPTLISSGLFYPKNCTKSADRLAHYAKEYPCVEVDSSTYAIPQRKVNEEWVNQVPDGFLFHFKAYGLLALMSVSPRSLPYQVRDKINEMLLLKDNVNQTDLGDDLVKEIFEVQNQAFAPFHKANKLGMIVFQFQANVKQTTESWDYVLKCRQLLDKDYTMGVEFRATSWFHPQANYDKTIKLCKDANIVLIGVDELIESDKKFQESLICIDGKLTQKVPNQVNGPKKLMLLNQTHENVMFVRFHRRYGDDRKLLPVELNQWKDAVMKCAQSASKDTTIYLMWNTNYENHSFINAKAIAELISKQNNPNVSVFDWRALMLEREMSSKKSILSFFGKKPSKSTTSTAKTTTTTTATSTTTASSKTTASVKPTLSSPSKTTANKLSGQTRKESPNQSSSPKAKKAKLVEGQSTLGGFFKKKKEDEKE